MTAAQALQELQARVRSFADVESRIVRLQHRTNLAQRAAFERGDTQTEEQARETQRRLHDLFQRYRATREEWNRLVGLVPGLGAVPVVYAGAVVALAGAVVFIIARVDAEERIVRMLEEGDLTPEQAKELLDAADAPGRDPVGAIGEAAKWVGFAIVGYLGFQAFKDFRVGGLRSW